MLAFIQYITGWYSPQYYNGSLMWISTNVTNIYLASIRFRTFQYLCNTLYKSHHIPAVLGFLPYWQSLTHRDICSVFFLSERSLQLGTVSDIPSKIYCHALALGVGFSHSKKTLMFSLAIVGFRPALKRLIHCWTFFNTKFFKKTCGYLGIKGFTIQHNPILHIR
jgi:hypothetical protein